MQKPHRSVSRSSTTTTKLSSKKAKERRFAFVYYSPFFVVVAGDTRVLPFAVSCLPPRRFKSAKEGEKKPSSLEKKGFAMKETRFSIIQSRKKNDVNDVNDDDVNDKTRRRRRRAHQKPRKTSRGVSDYEKK
tara:strand:- start:526 stop:921 length:396 start_codon:yes stop_codon:yes gene_type:complete